MRDHLHRRAAGVGGINKQFPPSQSRFLCALLGKPQFGVVIDDQLVAIGRLDTRQSASDTPAARAWVRISRSTMCSTLRPSTRQLISQVSISQTPSAVGPANDHADHAIVTEDVGQPNLQGKDLGIVLGGGNFRIGIATRGQVVLVGLVDKLNDSRPSSSIEWLERDGHIQRGKISVDAAHLLLQGGALGVVLIEAGAVADPQQQMPPLRSIPPPQAFWQ